MADLEVGIILFSVLIWVSALEMIPKMMKKFNDQTRNYIYLLIIVASTIVLILLHNKKDDQKDDKK